jgi:TonB family protein
VIDRDPLFRCSQEDQVQMISRFLIVAIAGLAFGVPAARAEQDVDKAPNWKRAPSEQDFLSVFPTAAMQAGKGGKVVLSCRITVVGAPTGCAVLSETPPGLGFGQAALTIIPQMLFNPAIKDGKPVEANAVKIPMTFVAPEASIGSRIKGGVDLTSTSKVLSRVSWTATPSLEDVWSAYPPEARSQKRNGRVTLECIIQRDGALGSCRSQNLDADSSDFLPGAKALAKKFRAPVAFREGGSTAGVHVLVPFEFRWDQAAVPTFSTKLPWVAIPAGESFEAELAPVLKNAGVRSIQVRAECSVGPDGRLKDCTVKGSTPEISNLQPAIDRLAPGFILPRWTDTGATYSGGKVVLPLRYSLD